MRKQLLFLLMSSCLLFTQCKKSSSDDTLSGIAGTGTFTIAGKTYSGTCVADQSTSIVGIVSQSGDVLSIANMPGGSNGSTQLADGWNQPAGKPSLVVSAGTIFRGSKAGTGTITKTGAKSFTLTCTVYSIVESGTSTITASGTYK